MSLWTSGLWDPGLWGSGLWAEDAPVERRSDGGGSALGFLDSSALERAEREIAKARERYAPDPPLPEPAPAVPQQEVAARAAPQVKEPRAREVIAKARAAASEVTELTQALIEQVREDARRKEVARLAEAERIEAARLAEEEKKRVERRRTFAALMTAIASEDD